MSVSMCDMGDAVMNGDLEEEPPITERIEPRNSQNTTTTNP